MISSCRSCDRLAQRASHDSQRDNRTPDVESSRAERSNSVKFFALTIESWNANYYNYVCSIQREMSRVIVHNIASDVKNLKGIFD